MASVGHIAVGMLAARRYRQGRVPGWSSMASWSALSLLPDVDVVGFALGVEYGDPWGHRGATHSLALSVALGCAIGLAARWFQRPVLRTALMASAVLASHGLLDTMTDGGLGCALLWPSDLTRYFAPGVDRSRRSGWLSVFGRLRRWPKCSLAPFCCWHGDLEHRLEINALWQQRGFSPSG